MCKKTDNDRLKRIYELAEDNLGPVKSVSLKLKGKLWTCSLKMEPGQQFEIMASSDESSVTACRLVKKRLKRSIIRYNSI